MKNIFSNWIGESGIDDSTLLEALCFCKLANILLQLFYDVKRKWPEVSKLVYNEDL